MAVVGVVGLFLLMSCSMMHDGPVSHVHVLGKGGREDVDLILIIVGQCMHGHMIMLHVTSLSHFHYPVCPVLFVQSISSGTVLRVVGIQIERESA